MPVDVSLPSKLAMPPGFAETPPLSASVPDELKVYRPQSSVSGRPRVCDPPELFCTPTMLVAAPEMSALLPFRMNELAP